MTRWGVLFLATCIATAACGDDDSPTSPSGAPLVFATELFAANEVPPVGNSESPSHGAVQVTLNTTRDGAGAITAATADFHIQMTGVPGTPTFVGAHIHPGAAGVNGPVIVNTNLSATTPPTQAGASSQTWDFRGITVAPALAQQIVDNPAGFYFNVHTSLNPGGVSRGQLRRVQ